MMEGQSIVCFAPERWDQIWRNRHQIMSRLAAHNKVLFVEPRPYLRQVLQGLRSAQIRWKDVTSPAVREVRENLWAYRPPIYAPLSGRPLLEAPLRLLREAHLRRTMSRLGFGSPILWLYRPNMQDVIGRLGEKLVVYHIVDQYAAYEAEFTDVYGQDRRTSVEEKEKQLLQRADLVIVTSSSLLAEKKAWNPNTHWVPNAVDYEAFAAAAAKMSPPGDMAGLPRPLIGYVGAINEKLDYELLRQVALQVPGTLVLVGPVQLRLDLAGIAGLKLPNVHFLGSKSVESVPDYVAACDVCLMPYKLNEWTAHINPLKLYEYLAAGKPVVSTAIPAVEGFEGIVRIAQDQVDYCDQIAGALAEPDPALARRRMEIAAENTWDARVKTLSRLVQSALQG